MAFRSQLEVKTTLQHFERIICPKLVSAIKTTTVDEFTSKRRSEKGKKKGDQVSPATVNKDLRHLRAAIRKAHRWGYITTIPYFDLEKEPKKLPTYVTPEHFAMIYSACEEANLPNDQQYPAAEWWRGLVVTAYMTGWRISELLALRREDVDLEAGTAITRAEDNKGNREERVKLHSVVVDHLRKVPAFNPAMFPWNYNRTTLLAEFARIQEKAGIHLACRGNHKHTRFCHVYGFHDFRRAFATMNAERLTGTALQTLMRHRSFQTTLRYINTARQVDAAVEGLYVPDLTLAKAKIPAEA